MVKGNETYQKKSSAVKPYDVSQSFVRKIASRVSELITHPLGGWRANVSEEVDSSYGPVIDQNHRLALDIPTNEDHPITKRRRLNSIQEFQCSNNIEGTTNEYSQILSSNDIRCASSSGIDDKTYGSIPHSSSIKNFSFTRDVISTNSTRVTGGEIPDICSESSESTSGCSSLIPQSAQIRRNMSSSLMTDTRCSPPNEQKLPKDDLSSLNKRRPTFNTSVFSSKKGISERRSLSPFYIGRTTFGGAATASTLNCSKSSFMTPMNRTVVSPQNRNNIQPVTALRSQQNLTMSAAARKILDTLEQYSSPVMDARRIPVNRISTSTPSSISKSLKRKLPCLDDTVPTTPDLLTFKKRANLQQSTTTARLTSESSKSNVYMMKADDSDSSSDSADLEYPSNIRDNRQTNKEHYKSKIRTKDKNKFDDRPAKTLKLPNIALDVPILPKIDIQLRSKIEYSPTLNNIEGFTFSKPLLEEESIISKDEENNKPIPIAESVFNEKSASFSNSNQMAIENKYKIDFKKVDNKESIEKLNTSLSVPGYTSKKKAQKKCTMCNNIVEGGKCVNCISKQLPEHNNKTDNNGSTTTVATTVSITTTTSSSSWGDKFKPPSDSWVCKECFIRNKSTDQTCIACQTPKVSSSRTPKPVALSSEVPSLSASLKITKPEGSWKCSSCWIVNQKSDVKCIACGVQNSSAKNEPKPLESKPLFTFGIPKPEKLPNVTPPATNFKFGNFGQTNQNSDTPIEFGITSIPTTTATTVGNGKITKAGFTFGIDNSNNVIKSSVNTCAPALDVPSVATTLHTNCSEDIIKPTDTNHINSYLKPASKEDVGPASEIKTDNVSSTSQADVKQNSTTTNKESPQFKIPVPPPVFGNKTVLPKPENITPSNDTSKQNFSLTCTTSSESNKFNTAFGGNSSFSNAVTSSAFPTFGGNIVFSSNRFDGFSSNVTDGAKENSLDKSIPNPSKTKNVFGNTFTSPESPIASSIFNNTARGIFDKPIGFSTDKVDGNTTPMQNSTVTTSTTAENKTNLPVSTTTTESGASFGGFSFTPKQDSARFTFGSPNEQINSNTVASTVTQASTTIVNSTFAFPAKTQSSTFNNTPLLFGNNSNTFNATAPSSAIQQPTLVFGETTEKSATPFVFGAASLSQQSSQSPQQQQSHTSGSNFGSAPSLFSTTNSVNQTPNLFGNTNSTFGTGFGVHSVQTQPPPPQPSTMNIMNHTPNLFGTTNSTFSGGFSANPTQQTMQQDQQAKVMNERPNVLFGNSTATFGAGGFGMNSIQQQQPSNLKPISQTPNLFENVNSTFGAFAATNSVQPILPQQQQLQQPAPFKLTVPATFNFSGSTGPPAFTAQPTMNSNIANRRIKKAVRRTQK